MAHGNSGINGGQMHGGHSSHGGGVMLGLFAFCASFPGLSRVMILLAIAWLLA